MLNSHPFGGEIALNAPSPKKDKNKLPDQAQSSSPSCYSSMSSTGWSLIHPGIVPNGTEFLPAGHEKMVIYL